MPTRKQRRRRAKEFRHDYVWEDEEGNEVRPDDDKDGKGDSSSPQRAARGGRQPQPPSWPRTLRRGAIFAPVMFVVVMLLSDNLGLAQQLLQTGVIVGIFVPFSYFLDGLMYRSYKRRVARRAPDGGGS